MAKDLHSIPNLGFHSMELTKLITIEKMQIPVYCI